MFLGRWSPIERRGEIRIVNCWFELFWVVYEKAIDDVIVQQLDQLHKNSNARKYNPLFNAFVFILRLSYNAIPFAFDFSLMRDKLASQPHNKDVIGKSQD